MKKLIVDSQKCIGCGTCVSLANKTFKMQNDGKSQVVNPVGDDEVIIQSAVDSCPVAAISWQEK
ncbi:ferredoxin [Patescibacteria group bacterium]|nr:ferredoxin [Patescibacteria group bacterium]MBU1931363.1 ferredoxin [Patescibacteria group bacterium]